MEELGEFNDEYKQTQRGLAVEQVAFEHGQRELEGKAPELKKKEERKRKIITWGILGVVFLFLGFMAWKLLF